MNMVNGVYLAGGVRTAIGSFCGAFENVSAPALGSAVVKAAVARAGISPDQVDEVIFGNVVSAGLGQNVARQAAIGAGLSSSIGATSVNKVCGSGLKAVMLAAQAIQCGDASAIVAGGTENMSRAPYLLEKARGGYRMGHEEKLRKLRPAFGEKGTITAGNASSINDGAAALVVVSPEKLKALGLKAQAKILGYATFSQEPEWFTLAPIGAIGKLLKLLSLQA